MTYIHHEEQFDGFHAIINGIKPNYRLSVFRTIKKPKSGQRPCVIAYQADAFGRKGLKKLKERIGEFRYELTSNEYDRL